MGSFWIVLISFLLLLGGIARIKFSRHIKDTNENHSRFVKEEQGPLQVGVNYLTGVTLIVVGVILFFFGISGGTL